MKTKKGFGRLLQAGLNCEIIAMCENNHCVIRLDNGDIYHGEIKDLSYKTEYVWGDGGKICDVYRK